MIDLSISAAKGLFFDRKAVASAVDRGTKKALSKFGAYVRTRARSSIRSRKAVSAPGSPPSSHTGLLKKFIFFGYDPAAKSVVIGPVKLNGTRGEAPPLLEYGGDAVRRRAKAQQMIRAHYRPRPFMRPAFDQELPRAAGLFAGEVK